MYLGISVCTFLFHTWPRRAAQTGKLKAQVYFQDLMKCDERKGKKKSTFSFAIHKMSSGANLPQSRDILLILTVCNNKDNRILRSVFM